MLWLALYFPYLPLEIYSRGQSEESPLAVSKRHGGRDLVDRCNGQAAALGVRSGMTLSSALVLAPELKIRGRDKQREQKALQGLAAWAYQFSSRIAFDPLLLLLEVGGSLRLFGGLPALLEKVEQAAPDLGYRMIHAAAPTPAAAALLARCGGGVVREKSALHEALRQVPLARMTANAAVLELIEHIGLSTIGDCLQLPRPELARRVGPELSLLLDRLLGDAADPRALWQPRACFKEHLLLLSEISHNTALVFPARRLIAALCGFLRGRGGAVQHLEWTLLHRDEQITRFGQGLLQPSRDKEQIVNIFRERIERLKLPGPVLEITLTVKAWQLFRETTGALFVDERSTADPVFLERLRARIGEHAVQGLQPLPDYRPEQSWGYRDLSAAGETVFSREAATGHGNRPLWLMEQPRLLVTRDNRPVYHGRLQLLAYPRRIETGWWDGDDVARDYYLARNASGERLWVYRDRRSGRWYLHGFFD